MGPSSTAVLIGSFRKDNLATIRAFIGCENEKGSKDELLPNDSISNNTLAANFYDLLDQIEKRYEEKAEEMLVSDKQRPVSTNSRVGNLKKELRNSEIICWHLYDIDDLWAALKNYLRHLPGCPLGSLYYTEWSHMQWNYMDNQRNEGIRCLLERLQKNEYNLVKSIFRLLYGIAILRRPTGELDEDGQSSSLVLAARLGPYLLWERGQAPKHSTKEKVSLQTVWLISYMIDNFTALF